MHQQTEELMKVAHDYLINQGFIKVDEYDGYQREDIENGHIIYLGSYSGDGSQLDNTALLVWVSDCDQIHEQSSIEITSEKQLKAVLDTLCFLINQTSIQI